MSTCTFALEHASAIESQNRKSVLSDVVMMSYKPVNGDNIVGPKVVGFGSHLIASVVHKK